MKIFKNNIYHTKRVEKVSHKLDIPENVIEETLDIMYGYIKDKIEAVEVDEDTIMDEDEFNNKFPIIHIPSLGYLRPSYRKYRHVMKAKKRNENKPKN